MINAHANSVRARASGQPRRLPTGELSVACFDTAAWWAVSESLGPWRTSQNATRVSSTPLRILPVELLTTSGSSGGAGPGASPPRHQTQTRGRLKLGPCSYIAFCTCDHGTCDHGTGTPSDAALAWGSSGLMDPVAQLRLCLSKCASCQNLQVYIVPRLAHLPA